jgi:positive regulator of sigma E activity
MYIYVPLTADVALHSGWTRHTDILDHDPVQASTLYYMSPLSVMLALTGRRIILILGRPFIR